jgi:thiol:disulfide interchange protein
MKGALAAAAVLLAACSADQAARPAIVTTEAAAFAQARQGDRGIILHVYAAWSVPSAEVDRALRGPEMAPLADGWVIWHADVTNGTDADEALQEKYGAQVLPAVILLAHDGLVLSRLRGTPTAAEIVSAAQTARAARAGPGRPASGP